MQVQLVQQEVSKHFTKTAITLCQEVCQEVANNSEWRAYGHFEWLATSWQSVPQGLPILEVVASGKQPWRHRVAANLIRPVVEQAASGHAGLSLLLDFCIKSDHKYLLQRATHELGHKNVLHMLMSQGTEGPVLCLLKHYDLRILRPVCRVIMRLS